MKKVTDSCLCEMATSDFSSMEYVYTAIVFDLNKETEREIQRETICVNAVQIVEF